MRSSDLLLLGVDCATLPARTGLALGRLRRGVLHLDAVHPPAPSLDIVGILATALERAPGAIVALDAPLGWPGALGDALAGHQAGDPVPVTADALFSRATDHALHRRVGKKPLEVGADRIARTAVAALGLLDALRARTGLALPVVTGPGPLPAACAVEVYPAATVAAGGARLPGRAARADAKAALVAAAFGPSLAPHAAALAASPDATDAALCVVAAADVAVGRAIPPPDALLAAARREGWIWCR